MAKENVKPQTPTVPTKKDPFQTVIQNLKFHNFEEEPVFVGIYVNTLTLGDEDEKFTAHVFADVNTSEECYIGNPYSIEKAINTAKNESPDRTIRDIVFRFEFLGKTTVKGKPFNQFKIGYCTLEDYNASL